MILIDSNVLQEQKTARVEQVFKISEMVFRDSLLHFHMFTKAGIRISGTARVMVSS